MFTVSYAAGTVLSKGIEICGIGEKVHIPIALVRCIRVVYFPSCIDGTQPSCSATDVYDIILYCLC